MRWMLEPYLYGVSQGYELSTPQDYSYDFDVLQLKNFVRSVGQASEIFG